MQDAPIVVVAAPRHPEQVRVHDFQDHALEKAISDCVSDLTHNQG